MKAIGRPWNYWDPDTGTVSEDARVGGQKVRVGEPGAWSYVLVWAGPEVYGSSYAGAGGSFEGSLLDKVAIVVEEEYCIVPSELPTPEQAARALVLGASRGFTDIRIRYGKALVKEVDNLLQKGWLRTGVIRWG